MNNNIKKLYNKICLDEDIIKIYENIELFEEKNGGWAYHNLEHIKNVTIIASEILSKLNYDEEFIYKSKIACLLHDIGAIDGKDNHAYKSYELSKEYFQKNDISFDGIDLVLDAIKTHSDGFDTENIIALSLIFSDKLDIKKSRISDAGMKVIGNRQYGHIDDIRLEIKNRTLVIDFVTDGKIDLKEISDYYFTKKVFKAVESFAKIMKLKYRILIDNNVWNINNDKN